MTKDFNQERRIYVTFSNEKMEFRLLRFVCSWDFGSLIRTISDALTLVTAGVDLCSTQRPELAIWPFCSLTGRIRAFFVVVTAAAVVVVVVAVVVVVLVVVVVVGGSVVV